VGAENFFLFGLTAPEVADLTWRGHDPRSSYEQDAELRQAIDGIGSGVFARGDANLFRPLVDSLLTADPYLLLADYRSYVDTQAAVDRAYGDRGRWTRMSILNTARMGKFSSDRAIEEYCRHIWRAQPVRVELPDV
jgi:starch phosphorylase